MFEPFSERARAKINLALHVLGRRADGYHELDSIVAFADVGDELGFKPAGAFALTAGGPFASSLPAAEDNIISRAWLTVALIAAQRGLDLPPTAVHLTKNLPVASGIGGGSANAAAAMRGFLRIAGIETLDEEIMAATLKLGADVPVCLIGKACRMRGVGERITPLEDFTPLHAVLVNPLVEVSTSAVFCKLGLENGQRFNAPITNQSDPSCWRNDLAASAIALAPVIGEVIAVLGHVHSSDDCGDVFGPAAVPDRSRFTLDSGLRQYDGFGRASRIVAMSGSGATCFSVYESQNSALGSARKLWIEHPLWWTCHATLY